MLLVASLVISQLPCFHVSSRGVLLLPPIHHKSLCCAKDFFLGWVGGTMGASDSMCCRQQAQKAPSLPLAATCVHPQGAQHSDDR